MLTIALIYTMIHLLSLHFHILIVHFNCCRYNTIKHNLECLEVHVIPGCRQLPDCRAAHLDWKPMIHKEYFIHITLSHVQYTFHFCSVPTACFRMLDSNQL